MTGRERQLPEPPGGWPEIDVAALAAELAAMEEWLLSDLHGWGVHQGSTGAAS